MLLIDQRRQKEQVWRTGSAPSKITERIVVFQAGGAEPELILEAVRGASLKISVESEREG